MEASKILFCTKSHLTPVTQPVIVRGVILALLNSEESYEYIFFFLFLFDERRSKSTSKEFIHKRIYTRASWEEGQNETTVRKMRKSRVRIEEICLF